MKLSILVPTLHDRSLFLTRILDILRPQLTDEVELLINMDTRSRSTGAKRNSLLHSAEGEYISFVDDDDIVSSNYVATLLAGIEAKVDVVAIRGKVFKDGVYIGDFIDTPYQEMKTVQQDGKQVFLRGVQHLDAVLRDIALSVRYEDREMGEDSKWTYAIHQTKLVQTWHAVQEPIYEYWWRTDNLHLPRR